MTPSRVEGALMIASAVSLSTNTHRRYSAMV
jgi:hypothetical protein